MSELGKKISELTETTDLAGLYTIGTDKNTLSKKVSLQFVKEAAEYANAQGDYAKEIADAAAANLGINDFPKFSASEAYVKDDVVVYNGRLYKFVQTHAAGPWIGIDVEPTSIKEQIDEAMAELTVRVEVLESGGGGPSGGGAITIVSSEENLELLDLEPGNIASVATEDTVLKTLSEMEENDRVQELVTSYPEGASLSDPSQIKLSSPGGLEIILATEADAVTVTYGRNETWNEPEILADYSVSMPSINPEAVEKLDSLIAEAEGGMYYSGLVSGTLTELAQFFSMVVITQDANAYVKTTDFEWEKLLKEEDLPDMSQLATKTDLETLTTEVIANEEVTAAALNDLNDKIAEVEAGAQTITVDAELSDSSENPVQNKVITAGLGEKQDALVSGTSIKTINGNSLLGSGDLEVVTDISNCATKDELAVVSEAVTANKAETDSAIQNLITEIEASEKVAAASLNELNDKITEIIARLDALSA